VVQTFIRTIIDPEVQNFMNAAFQFTMAKTRVDSGAAIRPEEFLNTLNQFIELPGDSEQLQQQKRFTRKSVADNLAIQANVGLTSNLVNGAQVRKETRAFNDSLFPSQEQRKSTDQLLLDQMLAEQTKRQEALQKTPLERGF